MAAFGKKKKASEFPDVIPVSEAIRKGDIFTKLTCLIMGAGNLARKQIIQGLLFLAGELAYILYMVFYGAKALQNFVTLGTETQKKVFNEATQVYEYATGDNSQLCLLYGVVTFFVTIGFILLWRAAIRSSYIAQKAQEAGKKPITFGQILKDFCLRINIIKYTTMNANNSVIYSINFSSRHIYFDGFPQINYR